jgi:CheY-like chemotaxis protein
VIFLSSKPDQSTVPSEPGSTDGRIRILVADDYPDAADSFAQLLTAEGFDVQIATDGQDALERALICKPHVCILNLTMPRMDGREVARWMQHKALLDRPLLIALTGWNRPDDHQRTLEAGFDHHFAKPADPAAVIGVIRAALLQTK